MLNKDFYFSAVEGKYFEEDSGIVIIFCPIDYWNKNKCLTENPVYDLMDHSAIKFADYHWYIGLEHTAIFSKNTLDKCITDFSSFGFINNDEMKNFIISCYE